MAVRHLRVSAWHLLIAVLLGVLITTGCGKNDGADGEVEYDENGNALNFDPNLPRTYSTAGNMSLPAVKEAVTNLSDDIPKEDILAAIATLQDANATQEQLAAAMGKSYRQLIQWLQSKGLKDRAAADAALRSLANKLAAKQAALNKEKGKTKIISGIKDMLKMVIGAVVQIIGMFKK